MPQLAGMSLAGGDGSPTAPQLSSSMHQQNWERGIIDYTGVDRCVI